MPSYLRTGERMQGRSSKIVNQFRPMQHSIFASRVGRIVANRLVIHLQTGWLSTSNRTRAWLEVMANEPGPAACGC